MSNSKLTLVLVAAAIVLFLGLTVVGMPRLTRPVEVTVIQEEQPPDEVEAEEIVEEEPSTPVTPPPPEPELPCEGLTSPGCPVYGVRDDKVLLIGNLKPQYFHCKVRKKVEAEKNVYYLIEIAHEQFRQDFYLIETKNVTLLVGTEESAPLPG